MSEYLKKGISKLLLNPLWVDVKTFSGDELLKVLSREFQKSQDFRGKLKKDLFAI